MPLDSVASLVDALRANPLLQAGQLEEVAGTLQGRFTEPQSLARELLARGWLTQFQIKRLFQGRGAELVLGPYVMLDRIGQGGMGQVFKARHRLMKRVVALKVIRKEFLANAETVLRFQREIEVAARLAHPNIVTAYDAAQIGDQLFLVTEYVEGTDLHHLVEKCGPLPPEQAAAYIGQAALGLQHAHERGLVHRDVKPSNLLLTAQTQQVKILDLGLALKQDASGVSTSQLTRVGSLVGTPDYMAPEQVLDPRRADIRADIYSLGCTFYFLLAARPPFEGGTLTDKLTRHQQEEPEPIARLRPDVPPPLAAVLNRMLAKRPEDRFQTPGELAPLLAPSTSVVSAVTAHSARPERPWAVLAIGGVLLAVLLLVLLVWAMS
jgi:serine/threonine-protein kinase